MSYGFSCGKIMDGLEISLGILGDLVITSLDILVIIAETK